MRRLHYAAVSTIAAVLVYSGQTQEKLFVGTMFDSKSPDEPCWEHMVDVSTPFRFSVTTDFAVIPKPVSEIRLEVDAVGSENGHGRRRAARWDKLRSVADYLSATSFRYATAAALDVVIALM